MSTTDSLLNVDAAIEDLRRAALGCVACKLVEGRTQVVFGEGNPRSPMVLVGQSPGEQEDRTGSPFVGPAGQLLNEALAQVGIRRHKIWITNVVKCRPYIATTPGKGKNRDPEDDEIAACTNWIEAELALIRPRVIVCIGAPSAALILGRKLTMTKDRGHWFTDHRFRPAHVMPVLHPAYVLRHHGAEFDTMRQQLVDDLESARRTVVRLLKEPAIVEPPTPAPAPAKAGAPPPPVSQPSLFDDL